MIDVLSDDHKYELDGFDISLSQCPPENLWPKNCAFYEWDMQKDIPERFHGIYDIVHARLVMGGLKDDPSLALRNFLKMLSTRRHTSDSQVLTDICLRAWRSSAVAGGQLQWAWGCCGES